MFSRSKLKLLSSLLVMGSLLLVLGVLALVQPLSAWAGPSAQGTVPIFGKDCQIGPGGGNCTISDGRCSINVAPNALADTYTFRLRPPNAGETFGPEVCSINIGQQCVLETFDSTGKPVQPVGSVTFHYTSDYVLMAGGDPNNLKLRWFNRTTGHWEDVKPLTLDPANQTITVPFAQAGTYTLCGIVPCGLPVTGANLVPAGILLALSALGVAFGLGWLKRVRSAAQ